LTLPKDPKMKILGINNRVFMAVVYTTLAVIIECFLNYAGLLTWEYSWWSRSFPFLIWLIGYLPFFTMAFVVHDMKKMKNKLITLGIIFGVDIAALLVFGLMGWM
jgi:dolichyl-phosphate-mannose--protein O-mannosyl transferase